MNSRYFTNLTMCVLTTLNTLGTLLCPHLVHDVRVRMVSKRAFRSAWIVVRKIQCDEFKIFHEFDHVRIDYTQYAWNTIVSTPCPRCQGENGQQARLPECMDSC